MSSGYHPDAMRVGSVQEHVPMRTLSRPETRSFLVAVLGIDRGLDLRRLRRALREREHDDAEHHERTDERDDLRASVGEQRERAETKRERVDEQHRLGMGEAAIHATNGSDTCGKSAIAPSVAAAIADTPAARPSRPSMKFSATFMPTIQKNVNATATGNASSMSPLPSGSSTKSMWMPAAMTMN